MPLSVKYETVYVATVGFSSPELLSTEQPKMVLTHKNAKICVIKTINDFLFIVINLMKNCENNYIKRTKVIYCNFCFDFIKFQHIK